jgi:signal transduction histidine kinase
VAVDLPADLPQVEVDAVQIDRVLTNLLENSLRHSGTHEPVQVTAAWPSKAQGGRFVDVSVIDRGIGFAADVRAHLFEPFNAASNAGGTTGLGLAVCRSIVTAHGGTISVDEQAGRGAQITFSLPVTPTSNNPAGRG